MKYIYILIFIFNTVLTFGQKSKPIVVSSASMFSDMVKNIAGDLVSIHTIVPIGGDPHKYSPTPGDAKLVNSADLILLNGLTFEGWVDELVENSGTKATISNITEGIKPIESSSYKNSFDPHAWMDASAGLIYIKNIKDALIKLDPGNKRSYEFNYGIYKDQLEQLDAYIFSQIEKIPKEKRILITSHDAFQYFGRRYNIRLEAILGTSTDAQVQTSDVKRISNILQKSNVPSVFIESTINPKLLKQIASDHQVRVSDNPLFSDSLGDENSPASTYYDMVKHNTDVIVAALTYIAPPDEAIGKELPKQSNLWMYVVGGLLLAIILLLIIRRRNSNKDEE